MSTRQEPHTSKPGSRAHRTGLEIVEESFHLVRGASWTVLGVYYAGTLPFITAVFFFWNEYGRGIGKPLNLGWMSLLLALLFIWMKTWQAVYARMLYENLETNGQYAAPVDARRLLRTLMRQAIIQSTGMVLLPVALLSVIGFPWAYAFYQNATALEDGSARPAGELMAKSSAYAKVWMRQCVLVVWALCPLILLVAMNGARLLMMLAAIFSPRESVQVLSIVMGIYLFLMTLVTPFPMIVAINVSALLFAAPMLLKLFLGVETDIVAIYLVSDGIIFMLVSLLAYALVDPFAKAAFVLRCFYTASIQSGADLLAEVARYKGTAVLLILAAVALAGFPALAVDESTGETADAARPTMVEPPPASVDETALNTALDRELEQGLYAWRKATPNDRKAPALGMLQSVYDTLASWYRRLVDWWERTARRGGGEDGGSGSSLWSAAVAWYVCIFLVIMLGIVAGVMVYRKWRRGAEEPLVAAQLAPRRVNLEDEGILPDSLPEDEWRALAMQLRDAGELRLALRAAFLGTLSILGERRYISIARFKSNYDYARELRFRGPAAAPVYDAFGATARVYEAAWYGEHAVSGEMLATTLATQEWMRSIG